MIPKLESAKHVRGHTIHVRFADGVEANLDLSSELWGEVFEPLRDPRAFLQFRIDEELNTVTWPSGADLAPEFLYRQALQAGVADRPPPGR